MAYTAITTRSTGYLVTATDWNNKANNWTWIASMKRNGFVLSGQANGTELIPSFQAAYDQKATTSTTTSSTWQDVSGAVWTIAPTGTGDVVVTTSTAWGMNNPAVGQGQIQLAQTAGDGTFETRASIASADSSTGHALIGRCSGYTQGTTLTFVLQFQTNGAGTVEVYASHGVVYEVPAPRA